MSAPYNQDDITWCVSHAKAIPRWMNLFFLADLPTVLIAVAIIIIVIALIYMFLAFEDQPIRFDLIYCTILFFQIITQFPTMFQSNRYSTRFLFTMMLMLGFWMSTIFGVLFIVLLGRDLYEVQIDTIEDIVRENYQLAGNPNVIDHFKVKTMVRLH